MSLLNQVFQGSPLSLGATAAGGSPIAPNVAIDTVNNVLYLSAGNGWQPGVPSMLQKAFLLNQSANVANVSTFAVPASLGGLYSVEIYEVSSNTPTGATLPAVTVTFTDIDLGTSVTNTLASVGSVSAAGVVNQGILYANAKGGTNIVVATTSYAAGSGTALTYNIKVRFTWLG